MLKDELSRRVFKAAIFFVLGLGTVFISLGATASVIGQTLLTYKNDMMLVGGVVILLFALHFLGVFKVSLFYREARFEAGSGGGKPLGAYVMGLAFAFGWTPCIGPVLGAILLWAGSEETLWEGVKLLGVYTLGLGLPFLLAALFVNQFINWMRRFRRHLGKVEKAMGIMLLVVGLSFIFSHYWVADTAKDLLGITLPGFENFAYWMQDSFPALANIEGLVGLEDDGIEVSLFAAFAGGLLSFLSPCVLPLAPPYLAFLAGSTLDELTASAAKTA